MFLTIISTKETHLNYAQYVVFLHALQFSRKVHKIDPMRTFQNI
jgi:hypothetical protein